MDDPRVELTWIGTATVLLRLGPFTVLTDPNFLRLGEHARLGWGLRSPRRTDPALEISALPPLDLVVLSHHHGDHFDDVAARELDRRVPIVSTEHAVRKLREQGFEHSRALATWSSFELADADARLTVTSLPGKHAPAALVPWMIPPVMGSMLDLAIDGELRLRIYISGDTLMHDDLREIPRRFPGVDLALLHLGGTRIAGLLLTMDAEQGVEAVRLVRPRTTVPIHHGDYPVFREPVSAFLERIERAGLGAGVVPVTRGEALPIPVRGSRRPAA
jgi:L-ascorbate metabolism protein UlaG (beta-lactamase superfamily)